MNKPENIDYAKISLERYNQLIELEKNYNKSRKSFFYNNQNYQYMDGEEIKKETSKLLLKQEEKIELQEILIFEIKDLRFFERLFNFKKNISKIEKTYRDSLRESVFRIENEIK